MFDVSAWLDRAKSRNSLASDYKLALMIGVSPSSITNYRAGKTMPDARITMRLCDLSGDDPEHVIACIQSMRAANDDEAELWQRVAARLARNHVLLMGAIALLFVALAPDSAQAAALSNPEASGGSLYIM